MDYRSQQIVVGRAFLDSILAALSTRPAGALVVSGKLRLTTDPAFNPGPDTTVSSLAANEANYSGYPSGGIAVTFSAVVNLSASAQGVLAQGLFIATTASPFVSSNVTGWWIDDGTNMIAAERFANGVIAAFGAPGDFLTLAAAVGFGFNQATA